MSSMTFTIRALFVLTMAGPPIGIFNIAWCQSTQEVHDFTFNFQRNCSLTINWTAPTYGHQVSRYIVQTAEECPIMWKSHAALDRNVHSMVIEDLALVTACLRGKCHIRVTAEIDYPSRQTERKPSHCFRISSSFYDSLETKNYVFYGDQPACLPIRATCPALPTFYIGKQMIALSSGGGIDDDYYLNGTQLCIRNSSDKNLVVYEVCHINTLCPLCDEDDGELVLMTRAEVQIITSNDGSNDTTMLPEMDCAPPSIVKFCPFDHTFYTTDNWVEVCICLPLYELHRHNSDGIMIELDYNSTVPGTRMNLNPNVSSQCSKIEVPMGDMDNTTSLKMCITLLGSIDATKCVHVPEQCAEITISSTTTNRSGGNTTPVSTITTSSPPNKTLSGITGGEIAAIATMILLGIGIIIVVVIVITCVINKYRKDHSSSCAETVIEKLKGKCTRKGQSEEQEMQSQNDGESLVD